MVEHEPEHVFVDRADPRPPPISEIDNSERREGAERFANDGARNAKPCGEIRFGGDRFADAQVLAANALVDRASGDLDASFPCDFLRRCVHCPENLSGS